MIEVIGGGVVCRRRKRYCRKDFFALRYVCDGMEGCMEVGRRMMF